MLGVITASYKLKVLIGCASIFLVSIYSLLSPGLYHKLARYPAGRHPAAVLGTTQDEQQASLTDEYTPRPEFKPTREEIDSHIGSPYFLQAGDGDVLVHYDLRYYLGTPVSEEERKATLHHMIRAYLKTFREHELQTWIAHGTLLGWWWNRRVLPWDFDLDVQVPEIVLFELGEKYNMTEFEYNELEDKTQGIAASGKRRYLLDVNPSIYDRERGWGDNFIDARWIDQSNGLFVDITGISRLDPAGDPDGWSCKNNHRYKKEDIWPLRESVFEGISASVPGTYESVLYEEYGVDALIKTEFMDHQWKPALNSWVPVQQADEALSEEYEEVEDRGLLDWLMASRRTSRLMRR